MTIFVGMLDMGGEGVCEDYKQSLVNWLELDVKDDASYFHTCNNLFIAGYDSGAFKSAGVVQDGSGLTLVVGDPIVRAAVGNKRFDDVKIIHERLQLGSYDALIQSRGAFAGLHYNKNTGVLNVFSDKLGVRPVYYYLNSGLLIFSSVFKLFEVLPFIDLKEDIRGLAEEVAFKYCLSDRTPYKYVKRLKSGELFKVVKNEFSAVTYWEWGGFNNEAESKNITESVQKAYDSFYEAVKLRLGDEKNAVAFLSGGLDSRSITALLKENVNELYTFNFATEKSQDGILAKLYSEDLGSKHYEVKKKELSFPNFSQLIAEASTDILNECVVNKPKYPKMVWSGDGGSVGTGFVYLNNKMISLLDERKVKDAVDHFLAVNNIGIPVRFFSKNYKNRMRTLLRESVCNEVLSIKHLEPNKRLYFFLMFNDQRRHLHTHFETIGMHKMELLLPFFDSKFLEEMFMLPVKECLYHKFYMKWFDKFPECVKRSPWQTYPGHEKCPLGLPDGLSYQWDKSKSPIDVDTKMKIEVLVRELFVNRKFGLYINRPAVIMALILSRLNIRNYLYLIPLVEKIRRYCKVDEEVASKNGIGA